VLDVCLFKWRVFMGSLHAEIAERGFWEIGEEAISEIIF
jgi:hypothetical protein